MGIFSKSDARDNEKISMYDKDGNEFLITRGEWRKKVLPETIRTAWNNPNDLYDVIELALQDQIFEDILNACERLVVIDKNMERSATILGVCLLHLKRIEDAKDVFENYIKKHGESGIILVNYAKAYAINGDEKKAEEILYKSLCLDPNIENALEWWGAIHTERGGDSEFIKSMYKIAETKGSWRPQLWIARSLLEKRDINSAINIYKDVLEKSKHNADAIYMISGDLGQNGYVGEIIKYLVPIYNLEEHGPKPAINILLAYLKVKDKNSGTELLKKIYKQNWSPYINHWKYYEEEFNKIA